MDNILGDYPSQKQKPRTNQGQTKEETDQKIQEIFWWLVEHSGQPAILFEKCGREMIPNYVEIIGPCGSHTNSLGVRAAQKCYTPDGKFRSDIIHTANVVSLLIGDQKIIFFDDGI